MWSLRHVAERPRERHALSERGFTLIEILVALFLVSVILTLGVGALRHFWLVRSLSGGSETVVTQMRTTQEKVVSESFPLVYGVRFDVETNKYHSVRYDPGNSGAGDDTCTLTETSSFSSGVMIKSASFEPDAYITEFCRSSTGGGALAGFVFFYPRGYATPGSVVLEQPTLDRIKTITVAGLTGRVTSE